MKKIQSQGLAEEYDSAIHNPSWHWTVKKLRTSELEENQILLPTISIVTPSLNQGQYLEATIRSVLNQGYPNLQYIIIDGGSTDNSIEIIRKYQDHLYYWCSEPDDGHYAALNKGFEKASGEIFAWINSDDLYCPWAFRTVAQVFTEFKNIQWLSTLSPIAWDAEGFCAHLAHLQGFSKEAFLDGCYLPKWSRRIGWIQQESTFWRKELWQKVDGLRDRMLLAADFDLWSRFYQYAELYGIKSPLGGFRLHKSQRSIDLPSYFTEAEAALGELRESCDYYPGYIENHNNALLKIPLFHLLAHYYNKSRFKGYRGKQLVHAGRDYPGQWKQVDVLFSPEFINDYDANHE